MRNIWVRIGLTAAGIFAIGMVLILGVRAGKQKVESLIDSSDDIHIPLMGIIPFTLGDQRLGDLRSLTIQRDAPKHLSGVTVVARLGDSATVAGLKDCAYLTVNDPLQLNDRTRFTCLSDTAGLASFGTVEIIHRQGGEPTTLVRTLVLSPADLAEVQRSMGPRVAPDSATMADLRRMGDSLRAMGDSIRQATRVQVELAREQARASGNRTQVRVTETAPVAPPQVPRPPAPTHRP